MIHVEMSILAYLYFLSRNIRNSKLISFVQVRRPVDVVTMSMFCKNIDKKIKTYKIILH